MKKKKVLVHRSLLDSVFNGLLNGGVSVRVRKLHCQDGTHPLELFLCMSVQTRCCEVGGVGMSSTKCKRKTKAKN